MHISKEFRAFLAKKHPYIHLVYVPANCTSKLQVADVALNFPFKHGVKSRFNAWASFIVRDQIHEGNIVGIKPFIGMTSVKPMLLEWALESWQSLKAEPLLIQKGWQKFVVAHYDINDKGQREKAVLEQLRSSVPIDAAPEEKEEELLDGFIADESESEDEEKTEKEIMKERVYGERKSGRDKKQAKQHGFQISSAQLKFS